jgi:MFS family permease
MAAAVWSKEKAQIAIIVGGCLATAYTQLTTSPATIQLARSLGGNALHIGILAALPVATLFMQFLAAVAANHLHYRRPLWFGVSVLQRMVFVPIGLGPLLFPQVPGMTWLWLLIAATAVNHALLHFTTPLWMSWMGDYLPHDGLSRFWGLRQRWMHWTATAALVLAAVMMRPGMWPISVTFSLLVLTASALGLADICLFLRVEEPPVQRMPQPTLRRMLAAPFTCPRFRSFIGYTCFWHFAAMTGAPFISLFLLDAVGMSLPAVLLLWAFSWVGGAMSAGMLGRAIDRFGHRPITVLCTAFKAINMLSLVLVPREPTLAFWLLVPVFMFDALLNAGILIANSGFMLRNSPSQNRTMYIAAGTALAGMCGGVTAIAAGAVLELLIVRLPSWGMPSVWGYYALFHLSLLLRLVAVELARRVQEPQAHSTRQVFSHCVAALRRRVGFQSAATSLEVPRLTLSVDDHQSVPEVVPEDVLAAEPSVAVPEAQAA